MSASAALLTREDLETDVERILASAFPILTVKYFASPCAHCAYVTCAGTRAADGACRQGQSHGGKRSNDLPIPVRELLCVTVSNAAFCAAMHTSTRQCLQPQIDVLSIAKHALIYLNVAIKS